MRGIRWVLLAVVLFGVSAVVLGASYILPAFAANQTVRVVNLQARQFSYTPNIVQVNLGDKVIIHLQAMDVTHGFYLDGYGIEGYASPGKPQTIQFVANKAGTYRFRCSVTCGPMHPFMIGELKVQPNSPFSSVTGLAGVVALGSIAYVWRRKEVSHG